MVDGDEYTFISDKYIGIIKVLKVSFPLANHRYYAWHILQNFTKNYRKQKFPLWNIFESCMRATIEVQFNNAIATLKDTSEEVYNWLDKKDKHKWYKSIFKYKLNFYNYFTCVISIWIIFTFL